MCTTNTAFVAMTRGGRAFTGFNSGIWSGDYSTPLADADFVTFTGGEFVSGGTSADVSTSDDGGHFWAGAQCISSDPWTTAYNGAADSSWFGAAERLGVRALAGVQDLGGGVVTGLLGYNSGASGWTPTLAAVGPLPLNAIVGGNTGWVIVGGEGSSQSIYYKDCGAPMISDVPDHTRQAEVPAVFYFRAFDDVPSTTLTYTVTAEIGGTAISGVTFFAEQRVLGDIGVTNNNYDGVVNATDLGQLRLSFFSSSGDANYNPYADLNSDNVINATDLGLMKLNFFQDFATAELSQKASLIEWTPTLAQVGQTVDFVVTATNATGTSTETFSVLVTAP